MENGRNSSSENSDNISVDAIPATRSFFRRALSLISIEPAIFLASLGYGIASVISQVRL